MSAGFDARSLERRYAFLDACPESLVELAITLPLGTLQERIEGVLRWREALLAGSTPDANAWPLDAVVQPALLALEELQIARFCKGEPELTDSLLKDVLESLRRGTEELRSEVAARLRELEEFERARIYRKLRKSKARAVRIDREELRAKAEREMRRRYVSADEALLAGWSERVRAWAEIADVFGDLGEMMGRGFDLARGVLRHAGWLDLLRLRALIERLPGLRDVVRALGRLHGVTTDESVAESVFVPIRRLEEERREVRAPGLPREMRGVERGDDFGRMLPAEATMLGHAKLRMLWHARRAERALLTYRIEGTAIERELVERESREERRRPRPERGPIIAVIDTSGSMHGTPEHVAKALVLEALRTAHAERRRCLLYCFGGPGQVVEHELALTPDGLGALLAFLGVTFGGGTDTEGALSRVLARLQQEDWAKADVILVTDGEWPARSPLVAEVQHARERGHRFHGVLVGANSAAGMSAICDPVHKFSDWATAGGGR